MFLSRFLSIYTVKQQLHQLRTFRFLDVFQLLICCTENTAHHCYVIAKAASMAIFSVQNITFLVDPQIMLVSLQQGGVGGDHQTWIYTSLGTIVHVWSKLDSLIVNYFLYEHTNFITLSWLEADIIGNIKSHGVCISSQGMLTSPIREVSCAYPLRFMFPK